MNKETAMALLRLATVFLFLSIITSNTNAQTSASSPTARHYSLRIGVFTNPDDANALSNRLRANGFSAIIEKIHTENGTLNRVGIWPISSGAEAQKLKAQIAAKTGVSGMVLPYPDKPLANAALSRERKPLEESSNSNYAQDATHCLSLKQKLGTKDAEIGLFNSCPYMVYFTFCAACDEIGNSPPPVS